MRALPQGHHSVLWPCPICPLGPPWCSQPSQPQCHRGVPPCPCLVEDSCPRIALVGHGVLLWAALWQGGFGAQHLPGEGSQVLEPPPETLGTPSPPSGDIGVLLYLEHLRWFLAISHNLQARSATPLTVPDGRGQLLCPAALQRIAPGAAPDQEHLGTGSRTVGTESSVVASTHPTQAGDGAVTGKWTPKQTNTGMDKWLSQWMDGHPDGETPQQSHIPMDQGTPQLGKPRRRTLQGQTDTPMDGASGQMATSKDRQTAQQTDTWKDRQTSQQIDTPKTRHTPLCVDGCPKRRTNSHPMDGQLP